MPALSSFEVLAESLIPKGVTPPAGGPLPPNIPFVVQAYFVQVSLPKGGAAAPVKFELIFEETTGFSQGVGQGGLLAQLIDEKGSVNSYTSFFTPPAGAGFRGQQISPGETKIYSVTVLPKPAAERAVALPQSGTGWRGTVSLNASQTNVLIASPTHRQIYFSSANLPNATITDSVVYSVSTASGKTLI